MYPLNFYENKLVVIKISWFRRYANYGISHLNKCVSYSSEIKFEIRIAKLITSTDFIIRKYSMHVERFWKCLNES